MDIESSLRVKHVLGSDMEKLLKALTTKNPGILAAQVCTSDGFEVASVQRDEESHRRLAAIVSSLHALGAAMVEETDLGVYQNLIIEASAGKCLMMAIPGSNGSLLLTAVAAPTLLFGRFHQASKATCEELANSVAAHGWVKP
jgi:predicted regulator of Ras-like GTPase activity (Roadblock/LC7/MglB family)